MTESKPKRPWYRMKRTWLGGLIVLAIIINATSSGAHNTQTASSSSPATAPVTSATGDTAAPASQIGQVVKDGSFAFTVQSVQCGAQAAAAVNADGAGETVPPGAQECLVTMTVQDIKGSAGTFFASNQYAYDADGHQYKADDMASTLLPNANDDSQVNPGITITAIVPFQIPGSVTLTKLVLHDSAFSGGVTVRL